MVFRTGLTKYEIEKILDMNYIDASTIRYTLVPGIYENSDIDMMVKSLPPNEVKVNIGIDDIRLKSNLTTNKTLRLTIFFPQNTRFNSISFKITGSYRKICSIDTRYI